MRQHPTVYVFALALALAACAGPATAKKSSTDVVDGAPQASAPAAPATPEVAPGTCSADQDCASGEVCDSGRCAAAPDCALLRVTFAFDSARLDDRAMQALRTSAECLSKRRTASILVEGHCDERGTAAYNLALGARRADVVKRYLSELGVQTPIDTVSFGAELPATQGAGESAWAQNRRAELRRAGETRSDGKVVGTP
jgi:peptidoglycan-associated lipoprotein